MTARTRPLLLAATAVALAGCASRASTSAPAAAPVACPPTGLQHVAPNSWSQAKTVLAPPGANAIRLCRYGGLNSKPRFVLIRARLLTDAATIGQLVSEFNRLPSFPPGAIACPADDGSQILARLAYPGGQQVTISVATTGCEPVTNGNLNRTAAGLGSPPAFGPQLVAQLKQLTPAIKAAPPKTVTAQAMRPAAPGGLRPGTRVRASFTGVRVFANARTGFAITDLASGGGGTYPVATTDGGSSWRTVGPVLHVPAAQGPLAVTEAGVAGPRIYVAWCGACNTVIDATSDAGKHWWQTFMPGPVLAVLGGTNAKLGLSAVVGGARSGGGASLWVYRSADGRRWRYAYSVTPGP